MASTQPVPLGVLLLDELGDSLELDVRGPLIDGSLSMS